MKPRAHIEMLIRRSSLGEPAVRKLRSRTPRGVTERILMEANSITDGGASEEQRHISSSKSQSTKGSMEEKGTMADRRIVGPHPDGGWQIKKPGAERATSRHVTQDSAVDRARQILERAGGGELTIQNRRGRIRDSDTVPPGHDPLPPRDRK